MPSFHHARRILVALVLLLPTIAACNYTFSGGGGLPPNIETVYVPPVENDTPIFDLTEGLTQGLLDAARSRMGVQLASEQNADAIITATIIGYRDSAINFEAQENVGAEVFERRVSITARVEIRDLASNEIIWSGPGTTGIGEYTPATETEQVGQAIALDNLIQKVIDGAQSQW